VTSAYDGADRVIEVIGDDDGDGDADRRQNWTYDRAGDNVHYQLDVGDDDMLELLIDRTFDGMHRVLREDSDTNDNGVDQVNTFTYQALRYILEIDKDVDEVADQRQINIHGDDDLIDRIEFDAQADDVIDNIQIWTYDDGGRMVRSEVDSNADGEADQVASFGYDESGFLILTEGDIDADGEADNRTTYTRDQRGNALVLEWDEDADGAIEDRTTYAYECWE